MNPKQAIIEVLADYDDEFDTAKWASHTRSQMAEHIMENLALAEYSIVEKDSGDHLTS